MGKIRQQKIFRKEARKQVAEFVDMEMGKESRAFKIAQQFVKIRPSWMPRWAWLRIGRLYFRNLDLL